MSSNDSAQVSLSSIRQIAIACSSVATMLPFYRDVLGMKFLFQAGPELAFLDADGVRIMLTRPEGAGAVGLNSVLYFRVADIVNAHREIVARGAVDAEAPNLVARMPDHELWIAAVRDPDGNLIGLMEERR